MAQKTLMYLLIACCECGLVDEAPYDGEKINTRKLYREKGWVISIVDKNPEHVVMAPVCDACLPKVYPPEMIEAVRKQFGESKVN